MNKKLNHTKGPWKHTKGHIGNKIADFVSTDKKIYDGMHIHNGEKTFGESSEESEANARLIAAAPDMLECVIRLYKNLKSFGSNISKENAVEVIEKATGERIENLI